MIIFLVWFVGYVIVYYSHKRFNYVEGCDDTWGGILSRALVSLFSWACIILFLLAFTISWIISRKFWNKRAPKWL